MTMGSYITDEEAIELAAAIEAWKDKQPEYIAVKMTNEEIVHELQPDDPPNFNFIVFGRDVFSKNDFKLIEDELYMKKLNPKNYHERHIQVIPWG